MSTIAACVGSAFVMLALQALRWRLVLAPAVAARFRDLLCGYAVGAMLNALGWESASVPALGDHQFLHLPGFSWSKLQPLRIDQGLD